MIKLPDGVEYGTLTREKTDALWEKMRVFQVMFSDEIYNDKLAFYNHIWGEGSIFLELEGGFILFNNIMEGLKAQAHMVFWDSKLSPRTEILKECLAWVFFQLDLHRLEAFIPDFSRALKRFLVKRIGFKQEGILRNYFWYKGRLHDRIMLSIIREEVLDGGR